MFSLQSLDFRGCLPLGERKVTLFAFFARELQLCKQWTPWMGLRFVETLFRRDSFGPTVLRSSTTSTVFCAPEHRNFVDVKTDALSRWSVLVRHSFWSTLIREQHNWKICNKHLLLGTQCCWSIWYSTNGNASTTSNNGTRDTTCWSLTVLWVWTRHSARLACAHAVSKD